MNLDKITISQGNHATRAEGTCALEIVDWLDRERQGKKVAPRAKLTDSPACVSPVIATFVRNWNDSLPTDDDRARLLRPLLEPMLDTRTTGADEETRAWMATDWLVRVHTPAFLDLAGLGDHARALRAMPQIVNAALAREHQPMIDAAGAAARAAARAAAWDAAGAAARAAAWDAARAAAGAAAWDAAARAAAWAAWDAARAAAGGALAPTVAELQASAQALVLGMCAVGR